jgi:DNA-binding XRE family transcriptional regulator
MAHVTVDNATWSSPIVILFDPLHQNTYLTTTPVSGGLSSWRITRIVGETPVRIERMITELRSTPQGEAAWNQANQEREDYLQAAVAAGRMSKIKYYRIKQGLTQKQLANAIGTRQSNIARYERASYKAGRRTLEKVSRALGVSLAELL